MSGYLERLTSRHASPAAIRPRAAARFEPTRLGGPPIETIQTLADVPPATPSRANPPGIEPGLGTVREHRGDRYVAPPQDPALAPRADAPRATEAQTPAWDAPARHDPLETAAVFTASADPNGPRHRSDPAGTVDQAGLVHGPATAAPPPRRPSFLVAPLARRQRTAEAPREPDVVQVRIGRIEVRAVLPPPEPKRPRPVVPEGSAPLPLEKYLSGGRRG